MGETTVAYATRLREKANDCDFDTNCDERILEHLIQTIENKGLIQKCISKAWTLSEFLMEAGQIEDISLQMKDMKIGPDDRDVAKVEESTRRNTRTNMNSRSKHGQTCSNCGYEDHPQKNCPAFGKKCRICSRYNHFASVCRSERGRYEQGQRQSGGSKRYQRRNRVKRTTETDSDGDGSSDEEFLTKSVVHMQIKMIRKKYGLEKTVPLMVNDIYIRAEPDSGADVNVMDEHQYRALLHRSDSTMDLHKSSTRLRTLQNDLPIKGEFDAILRNQTCGTRARFLVIKGKINSPPLISKDTLIELGMMQIKEDGSFANQNDMRIPEEISDIRAVTTTITHQAIAAITNKFSTVFEGIGRVKDLKNGRELYVKFSMKQNAAPVAQRPRPVPYYLQKPLRLWLDQCVEDGIFESVPPDEPVTWCSPVVVQPKPKFIHVPKDQLQPNMIRACIDLRVPNKYMERNRITQGPIVEDFTYKFHECVVFSKLDLRSGYHQLMLHPDSRAVVTFSTPWGNYRPKRLVFGAKSSQDLFDDMMFRIFGDIPMCLNQRDDILVGGRTMEEHNKTLEMVFQRAKDFGITFNLDKCQFGVDELEFYGYRFTKEGLKPTMDKVKAVKDSRCPETKEAVRSFLGMTGYLSKFVPRYTSITAPLRRLTQKDVRFKWGKDEQAAFEELKHSITSDKTMIFFNPNKAIVVRVEASYHDGLSAGLFQDVGNGLQPVHFISRTMTDTEKRYSQTEKDALAVRWAKNRFRMYLLGAPRFKIITGHKPLLSMFNKVTAKLPPRIERWVMDMQDVDYELVYEPGKDEQDPLDFLSRHPLPVSGTDNTEKIVKSVINAEHAVVLDHIREETQNDRQLKKLRGIITREDWEKHRKDSDIIQFYSIKDELFVADGLVFRLNQIVLPEKLRRTVIKAAHSMGHLGMTKTKQMLRQKYWFPEMNKMVEQLVRNCYECQVTTREHRQEPLKMTKIPENPWQVVSVDFGGPYPDGHYNLVVIDKRTRYPEVESLSSTAMKSTKEKLKKIFATYGTPEQLETDNGPPFQSKEFAEFAVKEGFKHHRITPLHPKANGEAENFMKLLNKTEQRARLENKPAKMAIQELLTGYRSTPHPATGVTPYDAMMNRKVRTKLDYTQRKMDTQQQERAQMNARDNDYKMKIKRNAENKNTKKHEFAVGDYVLVQQDKVNKWTAPYESTYYIIHKIKGSTIWARRVTDGREVCRHSTFFKYIEQPETTRGPMKRSQENQADNWRETALRKAKVGERTSQAQDNVDDGTQEPEHVETIPRRSQRLRQRPNRYGDYMYY